MHYGICEKGEERSDEAHLEKLKNSWNNSCCQGSTRIHWTCCMESWHWAGISLKFLSPCVFTALIATSMTLVKYFPTTMQLYITQKNEQNSPMEGSQQP